VACAEGDPRCGQQHGDGASDEHRLATAYKIREPADQGTTNHPAQWHQRTGDDRIVVAEHPIALKESHAPSHVANGGGHKKKSCHNAAQIRLRVAKYNRVRTQHRRPARMGGLRAGFGRSSHEKEYADYEAGDAEPMPDGLPSDAVLEPRAHYELAR
jgi:hypothetical protein